MKLTSTVTRPVSNAALVEAIALVTSPVWGALSMANALAGAQTEAWQILHNYPPCEIVDEIIARDISLDGVLAACSRILVTDSPVFHNLLAYDPRPKCLQCGRRHYIDKSTGEPLSCGHTQFFRNPPAWFWTRAAQEAAL